MELSGQPHARRKRPPPLLPCPLKKRWAGPSQPGWTFRRKEKFLAPAGFRTPARPVGKSGLYTDWAMPTVPSFADNWWRSSLGFDGRPVRTRWEDNIKMDLQEVGGGCEDWMELAQNRDRWRALVSTVMNLRVPKMRGISWLAAEPVSFSRRTLLLGVSK